MSDALVDLDPTRPGSIWLDRLFLLAGCIVAVTLAASLRADRPFAAAVSTTKALQISSDAEERHNALLSAHSAKSLDDAQLADRIENDTLPLWREATRLMERSRLDGAVGERFEELDRCYRTRLAVSETMTTALRTGDSALFAHVKQQWSASAVETPIARWHQDMPVTIRGR